MNNYELMMIGKDNFNERETKSLTEDIKNTIEENSGQMGRVDSLGKKQLAFPIKGNEAGHYLLTTFTANPDSLKKINHKLRLSSDIIRYLIIKKEGLSEKSEGTEKLIKI